MVTFGFEAALHAGAEKRGFLWGEKALNDAVPFLSADNDTKRDLPQCYY